jgi:hypothetical protein
MGHAAKEREQDRKARARLRVLHHCEQVTRNVRELSVLRDFTEPLLHLA